MSTIVTYKGSPLTTVDNDTKTLLTAGKYCEDDFTLTDAITLVPIAIRPDAELIQTYTYDQMLVADLGIEMPTYSTTAKSLVATQNLSPTITMSYANYDYRVLVKMLAIPHYVEGTEIAAGRLEYWEGCLMYDIVEIPANSYVAASGKAYASRSVSVYQSGAFYRELYWSSASAVTVYATAAYGTYETSTAPTVSSGVLTIKSPVLGIRGHTTYLRSAVWSTIEDVRYQYNIKVYRVPKGNLNLDGWGARQATLSVLDDIANGGTLT